MPKRVEYEWDIETTDEYGDVVDHDFDRDFPGYPVRDNHHPPGEKHVVLIRYQFAPDGITQDSKGYAYIRNGRLADYFDDGYNVPARFHKKVIQSAKRNAD